MLSASACLLLLAALAQHARAQVYTASVLTAPSATSALVTYTVTEDTGADVPLASKSFDYPFVPYRADSGDGPRGRMQGYNICNSTTAGPESLCSTAFANSLEDFCIWGAPGLTGGEEVANIEGEMVAYCTTPRYGTRVLPAGALQGVQAIKTPDYFEVIGFINQTALGLVPTDSGGEEDPHGADSRGNPLGSLFYSSAFGPGPSSAYKQITEWHYFVGGGVFCLKVCDPASRQGAQLCQHIYDRIGCAYNAPADYAAINGTFQSCAGENQLPPGIYVEGGQTRTYQQPPESLGPISTIPFVAAIPATSQCSTVSSAAVFTGMSAPSSASSSAPTSAATSSGAASSGSRPNAAASQSASSQSGATSLQQFGFAGIALAIVAGFFVVA